MKRFATLTARWIVLSSLFAVVVVVQFSVSMINEKKRRRRRRISSSSSRSEGRWSREDDDDDEEKEKRTQQAERENNRNSNAALSESSFCRQVSCCAQFSAHQQHQQHQQQQQSWPTFSSLSLSAQVGSKGKTSRKQWQASKQAQWREWAKAIIIIIVRWAQKESKRHSIWELTFLSLSFFVRRFGRKWCDLLAAAAAALMKNPSKVQLAQCFANPKDRALTDSSVCVFSICFFLSFYCLSSSKFDGYVVFSSCCCCC